MKGKGDVGAHIESQCLKVAELTVRAEDFRVKLDVMLAAAKGNGGDAEAEVRCLAALINAVTRLESTARRAAADLAKLTTAAGDDDPMAELNAHIAEMQRRKQEGNADGDD